MGIVIAADATNITCVKVLLTTTHPNYDNLHAKRMVTKLSLAGGKNDLKHFHFDTKHNVAHASFPICLWAIDSYDLDGLVNLTDKKGVEKAYKIQLYLDWRLTAASRQSLDEALTSLVFTPRTFLPGYSHGSFFLMRMRHIDDGKMRPHMSIGWSLDGQFVLVVPIRSLPFRLPGSDKWKYRHLPISAKAADARLQPR